MTLALNWTPTEGTRRLTLLIGILGSLSTIYVYHSRIWAWASEPFWARSYYDSFANKKGALKESTGAGPGILLVLPDSSQSPDGMSTAYGYRGKLTPDIWLKVRPTGKSMPPEELRLITSEGDYFTPDFVRLREHPSDTTLYYKVFPVGADAELGVLAWLAYLAILIPPIAGFAGAALSVLSIAWVVDGFRPAAPAQPKR